MKKATELRQILDNLQKVDDDGRRASLLDQLLSTDDVLTLPEHPNPPGADAGNLTVDLMKHQVWVWCHCGRSQCADVYAETSVTLVYRPRESGSSQVGDRSSCAVLATKEG